MTEQEKEKKVSDIAEEAEGIKCPVKRAYYFVDEFLNGPMCGRCFPCSMGSYEARLRLQKIILGKGNDGDASALRDIGNLMIMTSFCKKGKDAARFLLEALDAESFRKHLEEGVCPEKECDSFIEYRVIPEKCTLCGKCQEACKYHAIIGEKRESMKRGYPPFEIRLKRCINCGDCVMVCPEDAIETVFKEKEEPVKA
jgi:NAD-dependent dihydropyrimidine dehydrogenase PreA subunit